MQEMQEMRTKRFDNACVNFEEQDLKLTIKLGWLDGLELGRPEGLFDDVTDGIELGAPEGCKEERNTYEFPRTQIKVYKVFTT